MKSTDLCHAVKINQEKNIPTKEDFESFKLSLAES